MRDALSKQIDDVEDAQARDERRARELVGAKPLCCQFCALGATVEGCRLRERMQRRGAWLRILRAKQERRHAAA